MGKSRVTPLKQVTIPRLELTAATVAVRTNKMILKELEIPVQRSNFWTDSMTVLRYIKNTTSRFHTFVANRLAVIHEGSNIFDWRYISTKLNPADPASRGVSAEGLLRMDQWIVPPDFLLKSTNEWPDSLNYDSDIVCTSDPEIKKVHVSVSTIVSSQPNQDNWFDLLNKLIDHHSSWYSLKRSVGWILKVQFEKLNLDKEKVDSKICLSVTDMNEAERAVLIAIQLQVFSSEISAISDGSDHVKRDSYLRNLDPILDDSLLRVGGRLHESNMPMESKHPVILPKNHHLSDLILRHIHLELKHSGRNHMLSRLREKYWIVNAPTAIRKLISKCVVCRKQGSRIEQKMANLPEDRLLPNEPLFTRVGVDYFGPFEVKIKRSHVKRYGVIFTCLASRAVHLEVAASLDTNSYINALRRFIARRGQVVKIRSDNGTNFVGAEKELKRSISDWNVEQIHDVMLQRNIDWQFNPPAGSHHGGVWERLIRSVRKVMNSVIKEQILDDESLHTLMCEIESILNSRRITRNTDSHRDLEPLTPNHLLLMKQKPNLPPGVFCKTDNYCRRRWRQIQYMVNLFWQRWIHAYLPLLQERQK
ncbi:unnamed protein product [Mytilus coruscus]|uniref:Integrase catalytic domain-containing protein n=1 Tax=Mytilus coruscus TaxID=42192 RepID=A0A6J8BIY5_MYTCO|nr:unnamed protein product [Mytilus coruscus]